MGHFCKFSNSGLYMDSCFLEREILTVDAQVNCHFVFNYLISVNKFIKFMNVPFEGSQKYVIDNSLLDKRYRFRYKAVVWLSDSEEEEKEDEPIC